MSGKGSQGGKGGKGKRGTSVDGGKGGKGKRRTSGNGDKWKREVGPGRTGVAVVPPVPTTPGQ